MRQLNPLNKYGQPLDAPIAQGQVVPAIPPWQEGVGQKIQAKQVKLSRANLLNPGTLSALKTVTGTISSGSTQQITHTLVFQSPHGTELNFAIPYISVYEGTAAIANRQVYPILGTSQTYGSYSISGGFDYHAFATTTPGSVISAYSLLIHNNMNSSGTYYYISQYKYLNFNSGTVI
jgi:hypothetical protein